MAVNLVSKRQEKQEVIRDLGFAQSSGFAGYYPCG